MHHPLDRMTHTTAFVTLVEHWLERDIAQWLHNEGSIRNPSHHERTLLTRSYISLPLCNLRERSQIGIDPESRVCVCVNVLSEYIYIYILR